MKLDRLIPFEYNLETLSCLGHLTALTLSRVGLVNVPTELTALRGLRVLSLSGNSIQEEAEEEYTLEYVLDQHPHLSALSLSDCNLRQLPEMLLGLPALKVGGGWGGWCCGARWGAFWEWRQ